MRQGKKWKDNYMFTGFKTAINKGKARLAKRWHNAFHFKATSLDSRGKNLLHTVIDNDYYDEDFLAALMDVHAKEWTMTKEASEAGIDMGNFSKYMSGKKQMSEVTLIQVCFHYELNLEDAVTFITAANRNLYCPTSLPMCVLRTMLEQCPNGLDSDDYELFLAICKHYAKRKNVVLKDKRFFH